MPLRHSDLHKLIRWNTPTISNALEPLIAADRLTLTNLEETRDFMPEMGPMVGYAMTVVISGSNEKIKSAEPDNFVQYRDYLASRPGPKIVVVQDLDKPACYGAIWGEVGANNARSLGCVGTITDGAVRDLDEMKNAGFKALARRLAVSHAHCWPVKWNVPVDVFGIRVQPGDLIHADKHGFIRIPAEAHDRLLEAARYLDDLECDTVIAAGRDVAGRTSGQVLEGMKQAATDFSARLAQRYGRGGEWK